MYIRDRASGVHRPGHQLQLLLSVLLLLSLALPQAIASRSRRSSSRRSAGAFVVAAPSSRTPTPPAHCRRWPSITTTIVMQAQVSSSIMDGRLPPAPFVVYLTPGVPEAAAGAAALEAWYRKVQECAAAGVAVVQLRDKRLAPAELLPHAQECRRRVDAGNADAGRLPTQQRTLLLVNGHIEVARACGADGVHLPEAMTEATHVSELNQQQQGRMVVGGSVHSVAAALRAAELGVDYLQVGTMFPTGSHPEKGAAVEGPELMAAVDAALRRAGLRQGLALVGVGGIAEGNAGRVAVAGADGVAVISGLAAPGREAAATVRALEAGMAAAVRGGGGKGL